MESWRREATVTDLEHLKTAFRASEAGASGGHLEDLQWEKLALEEMGDAERERALDHILGCRQCTEIHQALLVVRQHAHSFDSNAPPPPVTVGKFFRRRIVSGFLVAAAAGAVFVVLVRPSPEQPGPVKMSNPILRSVPVERTPIPLSPIGPTSGVDLVFSWDPAQAAPDSIIQLIDDTGEVLWTSGPIGDSSIPWPGEIPARPGQYYWRILSVDKIGGRSLESNMVSFEITNPP